MMEFEQHPTEPNTLIIKTHKRYIAKHSDEDLQAAVLAEREACAKVCDEIHKNWHQTGVRECAAAIRGRTE
jgi:hypothetical protein